MLRIFSRRTKKIMMTAMVKFFFFTQTSPETADSYQYNGGLKSLKKGKDDPSIFHSPS